MTMGQPVRPANIANIVAINQGERPLTMENPEVEGLSPGEFQKRLEAGCVVLDTRSHGDFSEAHIPCAYNIQLVSSEFEQRVGWIVPPDTPTLLVADRDADIADALHDLAFVGLDQRVEGFLAGGMKEWKAAGNPTRSVPQLGVDQLKEQLDRTPGLKVLDVREQNEWLEGHIDGAKNLSFKQLQTQFDDLEFTRQDPVAVMCSAGMRSTTAVSILLRNGFEQVSNVEGGMTAWLEAGYPVVEGPEVCST